VEARPTVLSGPLGLALLLGVMSACASPLAAQGPWALSLFVDPFPSPYQSDWETNPNLSSLTIINPGLAEGEVTLVYQVAGQSGRILASGRSDPLPIPPGAPSVFTSYIDIAGSSSRDPDTQQQMERTGRIPEGTYEACVTMADGNGFVLGESCASFTIVYPDPPFLLDPADGQAVSVGAPYFQWTPVQVPAEFQIQYVLQIAEILAGQTPEEALNSTIAYFQAPDLDVTTFQYPVDGQPFEAGKRYAWRVVAVDQNGFPPSANGGASEIRTFRFDDGTGIAGGQRTELVLTLDNAFDHDASAVELAGADPPATIDIGELCSTWDTPPAGITITADSPLALRRFKGQPAVLFRDTTATRWWIATQNKSGRRDVLIGGDCSGDKTRTRWIASKNTELQEKINRLLASSPVGLPTGVATIDSVSFGMLVLALGKDEVSAPPDFKEGQDFLGSRTLEVAPGLNTFNVIRLHDWGLWWLFEAWGFTEKEVEVTGFLGWDASWSLGGAIGQGEEPSNGIDQSTELTFLVLRADLPRRKPKGDFAGLADSTASMGLSIEWSVGDSTGRSFGDSTWLKADYSLDVVGKLIHTIVINDSLSLEGSIGIDLSRSSKTPLPKEIALRWNWLSEKLGQRAATPETGKDLILGYGASGRLWFWRWFHLDGVSIDSKISLVKKEQTFAVSGTLGVGDVDALGKLGISVTRKGPNDATPVDSMAVKSELQKARVRRYETAAAGGKANCENPPNALDKAHCEAVADVRRAEERLASARTPATPGKAKYEWRARFSVGHLSLGELLDLIRRIP